MVDIRSNEHVIRNIGAHIGRIVAPLRCARHGTVLRNQLFGGQAADVEVGLNVVLSACPLPGGIPGHAVINLS
jgi:hypothetical protein